MSSAVARSLPLLPLLLPLLLAPVAEADPQMPAFGMALSPAPLAPAALLFGYPAAAYPAYTAAPAYASAYPYFPHPHPHPHHHGPGLGWHGFHGGYGHHHPYHHHHHHYGYHHGFHGYHHGPPMPHFH